MKLVENEEIFFIYETLSNEDSETNANHGRFLLGRRAK